MFGSLQGLEFVAFLHSIETNTMVSTCVNFKTNTHVTNLRKDNIFHQENGFLGERIKGGLNYSPWNINKLEISLKNKERVKKVKKPGVVSAVLTSNDATETKVC